MNQNELQSCEYIEQNPQLKERIPLIIEKLQEYFNNQVGEAIENKQILSLEKIEKYIFSKNKKVMTYIEQIGYSLDIINKEKNENWDSKFSQIKESINSKINHTLVSRSLSSDLGEKIEYIIEYVKYINLYFNRIEIVWKNKSKKYDKIVVINDWVCQLLRLILNASIVINEKYIGYITKETLIESLNINKIIFDIKNNLQELFWNIWTIQIFLKHLDDCEKLLDENEKEFQDPEKNIFDFDFDEIFEDNINMIIEINKQINKLHDLFIWTMESLQENMKKLNINIVKPELLNLYMFLLNLKEYIIKLKEINDNIDYNSRKKDDRVEKISQRNNLKQELILIFEQARVKAQEIL